MSKAEKIQKQMNKLGSEGSPFVFLIDFLMQEPLIFEVNNSDKNIKWQTPSAKNFKDSSAKINLEKWKTIPVSSEKFKAGFEEVMWHIHNGDTYLLNFTQPTKVETNLSLEEIFNISSAPYKIYVPEKFVCFSPETFIQIKENHISCRLRGLSLHF